MRTPQTTSRRFPSPCFSLALAAEQMAQMPLTGRGCLQGANVGRGFPSPLALVPADQTEQNQLWPFSPAVHLLLAVSVSAPVCALARTDGNGHRTD